MDAAQFLLSACSAQSLLNVLNYRQVNQTDSSLKQRVLLFRLLLTLQDLLVLAYSHSSGECELACCRISIPVC
jgi:hypothetical protein